MSLFVSATIYDTTQNFFTILTVRTKIVQTASTEDNFCPHCYRCGQNVKNVENSLTCKDKYKIPKIRSNSKESSPQLSPSMKRPNKLQWASWHTIPTLSLPSSPWPPWAVIGMAFIFIKINLFRYINHCTVVELIRERVTKLFHNVSKAVQWICSHICHKNKSAYTPICLLFFVRPRDTFFLSNFLKFPYFWAFFGIFKANFKH